MSSYKPSIFQTLDPVVLKRISCFFRSFNTVGKKMATETKREVLKLLFAGAVDCKGKMNTKKFLCPLYNFSC